MINPHAKGLSDMFTVIIYTWTVVTQELKR